jgi:leucyl/phenylalanyl-tRNA--protein transferase
MPVFALSDRLSFPPPHLAIKEGLLAVGGDLSVERLLLAYRSGIFPWYSEGEPILWWSPDPRLVLYPDELRISRSLRKVIKKKLFHITFDRAFESVIHGCAVAKRSYGEGTWITDEMKAAYIQLHRQGYAHSVEAWRKNELVGGLYGVAMGRAFFGESMFSRVSNASKVAFVSLVEILREKHFTLIDCQVRTDHLVRFGAREISRKAFLEQLGKAAGYHGS